MTDSLSSGPPREAKFWSCSPDDEVLTCTDPEEAAQEWVDRLDADDEIPAEVTVYGYAPMILRATDVHDGWLLDTLLERLDEEHGNPDEATKPSEAMKAAELAFIDAVIAEYKVWACEQVETRTVATKNLDLSV